MRRWFLLLALAALASPLAAAEKTPEPAQVPPLTAPPAPISDMMVDVQRLQARMAHGDKQAYVDQHLKMRAVGAAIAAAGPDAFKVKAERDAVVVYLLSGGQPRDIGKIVQRGDFPVEERDLLRGAAGYASGREDDADALLPYDPRVQSLRLGAQLAYAQSVLTTPKDAKKAIELLDLSRILAPGTLIEEAALRREVLLVGDLRDPEKVAFYARQYVERFSGSIYAGNFVSALSETVVRFDLVSRAADLAKFSSLLNVAQPEQARAFLISVARASLMRGRFDVASQAARSALDTGTPDPTETARARLYDVAARFPEMAENDARAAFASVAQDKLTPPDRDIFAAAAFVDAHLYELPPLDAYEDLWRETSAAAARSPDTPAGEPDPATAIIHRTEAAIAAAQAIKDPQP